MICFKMKVGHNSILGVRCVTYFTKGEMGKNRKGSV